MRRLTVSGGMRWAGGRRRLLAASVPVLLVATVGVAVSGAGPATADRAARFTPTERDYYINYVDPKVERPSDGPEVVVDGGKRKVKQERPDPVAAFGRKFAEGNPVAARGLAKTEAEAIRTGKNPRHIRYKQADETQVAKLLTILVEFNPNANDDFTGVMVPRATFDDATTPENERECVPGNVQNGPLHNNIPNPAKASHPDNNSMWVPDFSTELYNKMLYSRDGITERVRTDLRGPDGKRGIDLRGYTMRNMYLEMSKGAYTVDGQATPWVTVPHSEAWYGADTCTQADGEWVAGASQDMNGHPDNPSGAGALGIDAVNVLTAQNPDFPWADYDIEDVADADGDGNFNEPDGVIDHLVLVHAGEDKSGGGGAEGPYAIWAHSSAIVPGYTIPGTDKMISNYIVQPEDSGVGVFAHEYGHDLGLPDLYDIGSGGDSDVDFWDLMSAGSHTGPIFQGIPTHMGLWDKFVLGWADPVILNPGDDPARVKLGQTSRTPVGTEDGVRVNLPAKQISLSTPHSGEGQWWTSNDQSWADVRLSRTLQVPAGGDVRFWLWNNYSIEEDWDFGFVEVSTDGGSTWTEQKVFDSAGDLVSTDDGYADPNGRMHDYGDKKYGLTGGTGGEWRHDYVNLTGFAGQTVQLRLRYATDAAFEDTGWFTDDFSVTADGATVWSDDVESGANGWTATVGTFTNTTGAGWAISPGEFSYAHYYLAEWRNHDGFDEGLKYAYQTNYNRDGAWKVDRVPYNAPGMLVWYRDTSYGNLNLTLNNLFDPPSVGTKGGLLIVDSHFDPYRRQGQAAAKDPSGLDNLPSRPQSSNAAFGFGKTYPFTECFEAPNEPFSAYCTKFKAQPGVKSFTDSKGWYPGIEYRPDLDAANPLFFRDADASVVLPSEGNSPYSARIVDKNGKPARGQYGIDLGGGVLTGTGNPGEVGLNFGVRFDLLQPGHRNQWAVVQVVPPAAP
ncbi:immune inhibitor A domain-containing protein [Plantactinospora mayteni]|uniref:immune inhibitor A domain-containing protein n=1 Tax=Plantactinospora mayteni TaxID=566021 RepID=UPI001EF70813|nr:immune inhibitor A domain-containing protein [Plantactinospora mayteni]